MQNGNKILDKVIEEIKALTIEEFEKLHKEACEMPDIEDIFITDFTSKITYTQSGEASLCKLIYSDDVDVNSITAPDNLNIVPKEITFDQANTDLAKAA